MVNVREIDLSQYKGITRREAMLSIETGEEVVCRFIRKGKSDIAVISTMVDLSQAVNVEQKKNCDKLEFFKK